MVARDGGNVGVLSTAASPATAATGQGRVSVGGSRAVSVALELRDPVNDRSVVSRTIRTAWSIHAPETETRSEGSFALTTASGQRIAGGRKGVDAQWMSGASPRIIKPQGSAGRGDDGPAIIAGRSVRRAVRDMVPDGRWYPRSGAAPAACGP